MLKFRTTRRKHDEPRKRLERLEAGKEHTGPMLKHWTFIGSGMLTASGLTQSDGETREQFMRRAAGGGDRVIWVSEVDAAL